jgi:hypothetical protein
MVACELASCSKNYLDRKCKCYTTLDDLQLRGLPQEERIKRTNSEQFCAFEAEDGFLYGCDKGCCSGGCPGQCDNVNSKPPTGVYVKRDSMSSNPVVKTRPIIQLVLLTAFVLILLAILSLYA